MNLSIDYNLRNFVNYLKYRRDSLVPLMILTYEVSKCKFLKIFNEFANPI